MSRPILPLKIKPESAYRDDIRESFSKYEPILSPYYNMRSYIDDTIVSQEIVTTAHGVNKQIFLGTGTNGKKYAIVSFKKIFAKEIDTHLFILSKYLPKQNLYHFEIPKIYITTDGNYVMDYVDFDYESNKRYAKIIRFLENYCVSYGQFIKFIITECNLNPIDCESYVDVNGKLWFIDFGAFVHIDDVDKYLIKFKDELNKHCNDYPSLFNDCEKYIKCVADQL